jgi:porphobilinogen synthase
VSLPLRMRRLRQNPRLRELVCETRLTTCDLIMPVFVVAGANVKREISSMPGQFQWSCDRLPEFLDTLVAAGVGSVLLFGVPSHKDAIGSASWDDSGVVQQACRVIRQHAPDLLCIVDVCFCEYTDHGHCGVLTTNHRGAQDVDNDATLSGLARQAVSLVKAGADMVAPSGMMDGMVAAIRQALDEASFSMIPIMSYAVKFASHLYGPFREAADGAPQFGDRSSYQMNPANAQMALREAQLDIDEGADMLMVKPAGYYLDVVHRVKQRWPEVPLVAYQVSGEYAMIKASLSCGIINTDALMMESLTAIKRAGADAVITYFALEAAVYLKAQ